MFTRSYLKSNLKRRSENVKDFRIIVGIILKIRWNRIFLLKKITRALEKYEEIKLKPEKEKKLVKKIGRYFDIGHLKLINKGFSIDNNGDTIKNDLFGMHFTRIGQTRYIKKFLIRRMLGGKKIAPDEAYLSEGYPKSQNKNNPTEVLSDFIKYLKAKRKISQLLKFLRIKK